MLLHRCGVILFSNNDIIFDFDCLNAIQVFLSYAFSNKRFYSMMLYFDEIVLRIENCKTVN